MTPERWLVTQSKYIVYKNKIIKVLGSQNWYKTTWMHCKNTERETGRMMFWSQTLLVTSNIKGHLVGDSFWLYHRHFNTHELNSFTARYEPQKVTIPRKDNITQIKCLSAYSKGKKSGQTHLTLCFQVCHNSLRHTLRPNWKSSQNDQWAASWWVDERIKYHRRELSIRPQTNIFNICFLDIRSLFRTFEEK